MLDHGTFTKMLKTRSESGGRLSRSRGAGSSDRRGNSAVAYYRVSTPKQVKEGLSLEEQQRRVRGRAAELKVPLIAEFQDKGRSGRRLDREEFLEMIACLEADPSVGHVISLNPSRIGRNNWLAEFLIELSQETGVELHFLDCDYDLRTAAGRRDFRLACVDAAFMAEKASEDSARLGEQVRRGGRPTCRPPQGYNSVRRAAGKPFTFEYNEMAMKVRQSFELIARGDRGIREVLDLMNAEGLRTRTGQPVPLQSFSSMLRNRTYTGRIKVSGDDWVEGSFPAIVPDDLFESVQSRLDGRIPGVCATRQASLALMGYARCEVCGGAITGYTKVKAGKTYFFYKCARDSSHLHASARMVDERFAGLLSRYGLDRDEVSRLRRVLLEEVGENRDRFRLEVRRCRDRLSALPDEMKRLKDAARRGTLAPEDYSDMKAGHEAERESLEEALRKAESDLKTFEGATDSLIDPDIDLGAAWRTADLDSQRVLQTACFPSGVSVVRSGSGTVTIVPLPPGPSSMLRLRVG